MCFLRTVLNALDKYTPLGTHSRTSHRPILFHFSLFIIEHFLICHTLAYRIVAKRFEAHVFFTLVCARAGSKVGEREREGEGETSLAYWYLGSFSFMIYISNFEQINFRIPKIYQTEPLLLLLSKPFDSMGRRTAYSARQKKVFSLCSCNISSSVCSCALFVGPTILGTTHP